MLTEILNCGGAYDRISEYANRLRTLAAVVAVLETGVPRLACLRPTAWLHQRPRTAHLQQETLKTLARGQASQGGRRKTSSGRPHQAGSRGAERSRQRAPREVPVGDITTGRKPDRRGRVNLISSSSVSEAHEDRR